MERRNSKRGLVRHLIERHSYAAGYSRPERENEMLGWAGDELQDAHIEALLGHRPANTADITVGWFLARQCLLGKQHYSNCVDEFGHVDCVCQGWNDGQEFADEAFARRGVAS